MINEKFVILGSLINLSGTSIYIWHTVKGQTRPNRVSWFMWALAPMIAFAAELDKGVGIIALTTFTVGFAPLLVFISSFVNPRAVWKITRFDVACGILSLAGLGFWFITRDSNLGIFFAILADLFAAIPTIIKSYNYPESEHYLAFAAAALSGAITLLAIKTWTFANYAFPLYIFLVCVLMSTLIKFRWGLRLKKVLA
jgi:hypothetical protein